MDGKKIEVVVVGAGLSGIAAAYRLLKESKFSVKVLEASSKPGGRVDTASLTGGKVHAELGAMFLYHYDQYHSLTNCVREIGLLGEFRREYDEAEMTCQCFMSNGAELPRPLVEKYKEIFFEVRKEAIECSRRNDWSFSIDQAWIKSDVISPVSLSIEKYFTDRFNTAVEHCEIPFTLPIRFDPKHVLQQMLTNEEILNGTKRSKSVDLVSYGDFVTPAGQYTLCSGYQNIIDEMLRFYKIPLYLNSDVKQIDWSCSSRTAWNDRSDKSPVVVRLSDGSLYKADHVIVTVSIGVLQKKCFDLSQQFFHPSLPTEKLSAIKAIGMGTVEKLLIEFPKPVLDKPHEVIEFFWLKNDLNYPVSYPWIRGLDHLVRVCDSSVYTAFVTGESAEQIEEATEHEIGEAVSLVLEKFLQKPIDRPLHVTKSTWKKNPTTLGSYSYNKVGGAGKFDRQTLALPVSGYSPLQILFAGEATHDCAYSTTVGAFESGVREAENIIQHYM